MVSAEVQAIKTGCDAAGVRQCELGPHCTPPMHPSKVNRIFKGHETPTNAELSVLRTGLRAAICAKSQRLREVSEAFAVA